MLDPAEIAGLRTLPTIPAFVLAGCLEVRSRGLDHNHIGTVFLDDQVRWWLGYLWYRSPEDLRAGKDILLGRAVPTVATTPSRGSSLNGHQRKAAGMTKVAEGLNSQWVADAQVAMAHVAWGPKGQVSANDLRKWEDDYDYRPEGPNASKAYGPVFGKNKWLMKKLGADKKQEEEDAVKNTNNGRPVKLWVPRRGT